MRAQPELYSPTLPLAGLPQARGARRPAGWMQAHSRVLWTTIGGVAAGLLILKETV
jgi:hypothetical protein